MRIAVIILNWNGEKLLEEFLPSVCANTPDTIAEVIVADNGSTDNSIALLEEKFPQVRIIRLEQNWGYAEGYNRAICQVTHDYVVLLNSDVEVTSGWLEPMLAYCDAHPTVVACQPKVRAYNNRNYFEHAGAAGGYLDRYGYPYCRGRIFDEVEDDHGQYDNIVPIFWATGAALFIRRESYIDIGGLDANFFAHMEEIDLCWRLQLTGGRIMAIPQSVIYHVGGASLDASNPRKRYLNFRNNLLMMHKNMPRLSGQRRLFTRRLLDLFAAIRFWMAGQDLHARAVLAAYRDFDKDKKQYTVHPKNNILWKTKQSRRFIVYDYFIRGKKKFSQL